MKKFKFIPVSMVLILLFVISCSRSEKIIQKIMPKSNYDKGLELYESSDYKGAMPLFIKALSNDHVESAAAYLGAMYTLGYGVSIDYDKAIDFYKQCPDNIACQYSLGVAYVDGDSVDVDYDKAMTLFSKCAESGYSDCQQALGVMYLTGKGAAIDDQKAFNFFQKSAAQGNHLAEAKLGLMYDSGLYVPSDHKQAFSLFKKSADSGCSLGELLLATMYEFGSYVSQDYKQAAALYKKAAFNVNNPQDVAEYNLGRLYTQGLGVKKDLVYAKKLLNDADSKGVSAAKEFLDANQNLFIDKSNSSDGTINTN